MSFVKELLTENNIKDNPFEQFEIWFNEAQIANFKEPTAMCLSTSDKSGKPSSRMVLLKKFDERGFVFYTNYESRKAVELSENPFGALLFYWDILERQIRIEGKVEKISYTESEEYFKSRPYTARLGAIASKQSRPLKSRFTLMKQVAQLMLKYPVNVPLPENWGGYRLLPDSFEFWQGRENRLHDRFYYSRKNEIWTVIRLYP